jgi:hypothetical protein
VKGRSQVQVDPRRERFLLNSLRIRPRRRRRRPRSFSPPALSSALPLPTPIMSSRLAFTLRSQLPRSTTPLLISSAAAAAARPLSTTSILRLATQPTQTGPTVPGYSTPPAPPAPPAAPVVPKAEQTVADYSKGPSALDKASSLFFFTEILRGMFPNLLLMTTFLTCERWESTY